MNGNILTYNESEDAYYIQHGADSVPKKLGSGFRISVGGVDSRNSLTFNIKNILPNDYKNLTIDNFALTNVIVYTVKDNASAEVSEYILKSYNPTTGILSTGQFKRSVNGYTSYLSGVIYAYGW